MLSCWFSWFLFVPAADETGDPAFQGLAHARGTKNGNVSSAGTSSPGWFARGLGGPVQGIYLQGRDSKTQ